MFDEVVRSLTQGALYRTQGSGAAKGRTYKLKGAGGAGGTGG